MSWSSFALVSLVVQAKDVDLRSSVACGEERTACICARIDVTVTSVCDVTATVMGRGLSVCL